MVAPKLRFKGFSQNWFKISLSSVGEVVTGNTPATSEKKYYGDDFLWVSPADIKNQKLVNDTQTKLSILGVEKTRKIPNGSILVTCIGSTIGKIAMSGKELSTNQQINSLIPNSPNLKDFIYYSIECYIPLLKKLTATQAVPIINKSEFSNFKIPFTSENEAIKIGELFSNLDIRIQLQQEKIDLLKEQKKGYMQKIFNQELRFKGFKNTWEEKKLSDISIVITKGTTPKDKSWTGTVNYIKTESINPISGEISNTAYTSIEEHEGYLKRSQLQAGDILFSIVGTLGRVGLVKEKDLPANTNQQIAIIRLKSEIDRNFILNILKSTKVLSFINSDSTIGAQPSLSLWQINALQIPYTSYEEQKKIGEFFNILDKAIALQKQKLELLQKQKQAFMQQMFI